MSTEVHPIGPRLSAERAAPRAEGKVELGRPAPTRPLGVFDSGVGGLTVLAECMKQLPHEDIIYLADTNRVPYGGRPPQEIIKINQEILDYFLEREVKMVIMACGTSSSIAYPVLKDKYKIPIVALIEPGSRAALAATRNLKIGVIATQGTIESGAYQNTIKHLKKEAEVYAMACPLFVPLIEGGFIEAEETRKVAREYLKPLLEAGIDTLILGCTHYPHISKILQEIAGENVVLINPAEEAVSDAKKILKKAGNLNPAGAEAKYEFVVTGSSVQFQDLGSRLLGRPIVGAKFIKLGV